MSLFPADAPRQSLPYAAEWHPDVAYQAELEVLPGQEAGPIWQADQANAPLQPAHNPRIVIRTALTPPSSSAIKYKPRRHPGDPAYT